MPRCKCKKRPNIVSDTVRKMACGQGGCQDVCAEPVCGDPRILSMMAPVIYDEIGINLCATFDLGVDVAAEYPTATTASARVLDASYTYGADQVTIESLTGRPNCYAVTLTDLTVQFAVNLYDCNERLLDTIYPTAVYLPSDTEALTYDEDTNPSSVALQIFAPYGYSMTSGDAGMTPAVHFMGQMDTNNMLRQGLNLYGRAKLLDFERSDSTATVGLTLVLQSAYYAGYKVNSPGKVVTPKGSIISPDESECMMFVAGDLLNLAIKPLELGPPDYEENLKRACPDTGCGIQAVSDPDEPVPGTAAAAI